jgi:hypothetical protein
VPTARTTQIEGAGTAPLQYGHPRLDNGHSFSYNDAQRLAGFRLRQAAVPWQR